MNEAEQREKVRVIFHELTDVNVVKASIVDRGANQEPFSKTKIFKEKSMNIKDLWKKRSKLEEPVEGAPVITAVITKAETLPQVKEILGETPIIKEDEQGDLTILCLTESEIDTANVVQLDESTAVEVTGLAKSFDGYTYESDFGAVLATDQFYPSVRIATEAMAEALWNAMYAAEPGVPPVETVNKILADFSAYVANLVTMVPVEAFKFEGLVVPVVEVEKTESSKDILVKSVEASGATLTELLAVINTLAKAEDVAKLNEAATAGAEAGALLKTAHDALKTEHDVLKKEHDALGERVKGITVSEQSGDQVTKKKEDKDKAPTYGNAFNLPGYE
jgi:hypothetical protein